MPNIILNNVNLFYDDEGTGTPLILLHGLGGNRYSYTELIDQFKNQFRIIALDSRGHGDSQKPANYTLNDHIQDVIALMDHLGIDSANILGASMGSYIAQGVAVAIPDRVEKLLLVVSKSHGKTSSLQELMERHAENLQGLSQEGIIAYLSKFMFYDVHAALKFLGDVQVNGTALTLEQQAAANKALEGFDFRPDLHKVTAETLVISGKHDGLNPPELGKEIASFIPKSTFIEFEKSGHAPNAEELEKFMEVVKKFLID